MASALARIGDAPGLVRTQRDALVAFLQGMLATITRLVTTFTGDIAGLSQAGQVKGATILSRAHVLEGNINDELAYLNDSAQAGDLWFRERILNGKQIVADLTTISSDMVAFLQTGRIPSEERNLKELLIFTGVATLVGGAGAYLWWRGEKAAEKEQLAMLASGEIEDCGCEAPK